MAAAGAHVIAVARTVGGLEELDDEIKATHAETGKGEATLVPLDLADMAGIDRLGGAIHERWGKLDILVANAGVLGVIAPIGHVEAKTFEKVMTINVTVDLAADPLGRSAAQAFRCRPRHPDQLQRGAFGARLLGALCGLQGGGRGACRAPGPTRRRNLPLRVNAVDPRATRTAMRAQAMPGENPETLAASFGDRGQHPAARQPVAHPDRRAVRRARRKVEIPVLILNGKHCRRNRPQVPERSRSNNEIAPDSDIVGMEQALVDGRACQDAQKTL